MSQAISNPGSTGFAGVSHADLANTIRALSMDAVEAAQSGHPGMPMGMADVATVLFSRHLVFDPRHPHWPDRDRFVLSAGHGSMLLYALLYLTGYEDITLDEIKNFRQLGARTAGHPEYGHAAGIETTTGPLGQGLANAVGMALAERNMNARFGNALINHRTWVIAGDGCLMEGISQEAISLAGHLKLKNLIVLWDDNRISIDGPTDLTTSEDQRKRFEASGWVTMAVDGHDPSAIDHALEWAKKQDRPVMVACRTTIGHGAPTKAGKSSSHGSPLGAAELAGAKEALGWPYGPFEVPDDILDAWLAIGARGHAIFNDWAQRFADTNDGIAAEFERVIDGMLPAGFAEAILALKKGFAANPPKIATRQASGMVLDSLVNLIPELVGGSADLTGSVNTKAKQASILDAAHYDGRYVHYGVREHAMAAAMNGMALHGGVIPFGGTFLVFADYCRPAIRLSALMGKRVVYVLTHDSIGLGEDGPTHQPVEHLSSLRAIPSLAVFRPADAVETAEAWGMALSIAGPSVIALTRQAVTPFRDDATEANLTARGGYVVSEPEGERDVTLIGTGSELELALAAQAMLAKEGIGAAVVSMPCTQLFDVQPVEYRARVLGAAPRVVVEAGIGFGWDRYLGHDGIFVGMTGFGASGPAPKLFEYFGITAEAVAEAARSLV